MTYIETSVKNEFPEIMRNNLHIYGEKVVRGWTKNDVQAHVKSWLNSDAIIYGDFLTWAYSTVESEETRDFVRAEIVGFVRDHFDECKSAMDTHKPKCASDDKSRYTDPKIITAGTAYDMCMALVNKAVCDAVDEWTAKGKPLAEN